jgi:hypothetical protein
VVVLCVVLMQCAKNESSASCFWFNDSSRLRLNFSATALPCFILLLRTATYRICVVWLYKYVSKYRYKTGEFLGVICTVVAFIVRHNCLVWASAVRLSADNSLSEGTDDLFFYLNCSFFNCG